VGYCSLKQCLQILGGNLPGRGTGGWRRGGPIAPEVCAIPYAGHVVCIHGEALRIRTKEYLGEGVKTKARCARSRDRAPRRVAAALMPCRHRRPGEHLVRPPPSVSHCRRDQGRRVSCAQSRWAPGRGTQSLFFSGPAHVSTITSSSSISMSTPYHHQFDASTCQVRDTTYNWIFVLSNLAVLGCGDARPPRYGSPTV
jgi:hypothetical protein